MYYVAVKSLWKIIKKKENCSGEDVDDNNNTNNNINYAQIQKSQSLHHHLCNESSQKQTDYRVFLKRLL